MTFCTLPSLYFCLRFFRLWYRWLYYYFSTHEIVYSLQSFTCYRQPVFSGEETYVCLTCCLFDYIKMCVFPETVGQILVFIWNHLWARKKNVLLIFLFGCCSKTVICWTSSIMYDKHSDTHESFVFLKLQLSL